MVLPNAKLTFLHSLVSMLVMQELRDACDDAVCSTLLEKFIQMADVLASWGNYHASVAIIQAVRGWAADPIVVSSMISKSTRSKYNKLVRISCDDNGCLV